MLYTSLGPEQIWHDVDVIAATIARRGALAGTLNVQYACHDSARRILYVVATNGGERAGAGGPRSGGDTHQLAAYQIDTTGALTPLGTPQNLPARPLHVSLDADRRFVLTAITNPSIITVHRIAEDGSVGAPVPQSNTLDTGRYAHQVRTTPDNRFVLLPTRGAHGESGRPDAPGGLKIFRFDNGILANVRSHTADDGHHYGLRHITFHPNGTWAYLIVESRNQVQTFQLDAERGLSGPVFETTTLSHPGNVIGRQMAGAIHVHPTGRFLYVSNRTNGEGGEDSIAVFAIDPDSGEPRPIQHADIGSIHPRTFSIDPTGRILIAATIKSHDVTRDGAKQTLPAALSVFRINADGKLTLARKYDVDTGRHQQFWSAII